MPSLSSIMEQNSKVGPQLKNLVAVFVGGTCGIGEHTAYTFAKYTKSPTIYIIGRNKEAGAKVLENLRQLNSDADSKYYFYSHDLTLISEADKLNQTVLDQEDKINVLFLSAGYIAMDSRNESSEGIDKKMAVNYYSRWKIADELTPLVEKAADAGELSRVVSVLKAGEEGFIHPEDIGLKKNFTLSNCGKHTVTLNSSAVLNFSKKYPKVSFVHAFPGLVKTGILRQYPWYLRYPVSGVFKILATTGESSGEKFFYISASSKEFATGGNLVNENCEPIIEKCKKRGDWWKDENLEKSWEHTLEQFKQALNGQTK